MELEPMGSVELESLPLEQSMTVSDIDWKNDPYHVIAEDEKQSSTLLEFSEEEQDGDICEQSWGLYFAQKSGAMGNISGTSLRRPQFSSLRPQTPTTLSIEDLISPQKHVQPQHVQNNDDDENKYSPNNLLRQFEDCNIQSDNDDEYQLQEAIQSAIQRRKSLEPQIVINSINSNVLTVENTENDIVTMAMSDIKQFHRFIQFFINPKKMKSEKIDDIKKQCNDLLEHYVSKLENVNSKEINCSTSWININTNQCTFYILISCDFNDEQWSQLFLNIKESYSWIQSNQNEIVFSQFTPEKL